MVTNLPKDGYPFSKDWSPNIPRRVKHHGQDGNPPYKGWSPTNQRNATHPSTVEWSPTFPRAVTYHIQDGQLNLEFDSCAAQIVVFASFDSIMHLHVPGYHVPHHLQNQKWLLGAQKWPTGFKKVSTRGFLGASVNFCYISFLIQALLL